MQNSSGPRDYLAVFLHMIEECHFNIARLVNITHPISDDVAIVYNCVNITRPVSDDVVLVYNCVN